MPASTRDLWIRLGALEKNCSVSVVSYYTSHDAVEAVRRSSLAKDAAIVVYCAGPSCPQSRQAAEKLATFGYTRVDAYEGGLEEWKQAGFGIVGTGTSTAQ